MAIGQDAIGAVPVSSDELVGRRGRDTGPKRRIKPKQDDDVAPEAR